MKSLNLLTIPVITTTVTVILTLVVTYLSASITNAMRKQRLDVSIYYSLQNIILKEKRFLKIAYKESLETNKNVVHIDLSIGWYDLSVIDLIQICDVDNAAAYLFLDISERYSAMHECPQNYPLEEVAKLLSLLKQDYYFITQKLREARNKTWFYYWWDDIKMFLSVLPNALPKTYQQANQKYQQAKKSNQKQNRKE